MLYMKDHRHWMPKISCWHHQGWIRSFRSLFWPEVWEAPGETVTSSLLGMWVFEERWIFTCSQRDMVQSVSVQLNWTLDAFLTAVKGLKCFFSCWKANRKPCGWSAVLEQAYLWDSLLRCRLSRLRAKGRTGGRKPERSSLPTLPLPGAVATLLVSSPCPDLR